MLVVGVKLWILQSNPGNKVAKTHCKTTSNLTVIFVSPQLRALCQLDIRRPIRRTTTNNKAWDFSCYWESTCICRIVRKNIFNKNSFDIFCWTNKRGERLISRGLSMVRAATTSHLVYMSSIVCLWGRSEVRILEGFCYLIARAFYFAQPKVYVDCRWKMT